MYVVFYAKVIDDKDDGVYMAGIYFGGLGKTLADAEAEARDCVNTVRGGTILPKIYELPGERQLIQVMNKAVDKFRILEREMFAAEDIIERNTPRRR